MPPLHPLNETVSEYHGTPRHHQLCCQSQQQKNSIFGTPEAHVDWYLIFRYKKQQASHIVHPLAMESRESFSDTSSNWVHFNSISIHFNPFQLVYQHQMLWQPPPWPSWQKRPGNSQSLAYCLGHVFGQLAHPTESQALIIQVLKWNSNVCLHLRSYDPSLLCLLYIFKTLIHDSNCVYISVCYLGTWKMVVP